MPGLEDNVPFPGLLHHNYILPPLFKCHNDGDTHPGQTSTSFSLPGGAVALCIAVH